MQECSGVLKGNDGATLVAPLMSHHPLVFTMNFLDNLHNFCTGFVNFISRLNCRPKIRDPMLLQLFGFSFGVTQILFKIILLQLLFFGCSFNRVI